MIEEGAKEFEMGESQFEMGESQDFLHFTDFQTGLISSRRQSEKSGKSDRKLRPLSSSPREISMKCKSKTRTCAH